MWQLWWLVIGSHDDASTCKITVVRMTLTVPPANPTTRISTNLLLRESCQHRDKSTTLSRCHRNAMSHTDAFHHITLILQTIQRLAFLARLSCLGTLTRRWTRQMTVAENRKWLHRKNSSRMTCHLLERSTVIKRSGPSISRQGHQEEAR